MECTSQPEWLKNVPNETTQAFIDSLQVEPNTLQTVFEQIELFAETKKKERDVAAFDWAVNAMTELCLEVQTNSVNFWLFLVDLKMRYLPQVVSICTNAKPVNQLKATATLDRLVNLKPATASKLIARNHLKPLGSLFIDLTTRIYTAQRHELHILSAIVEIFKVVSISLQTKEELTMALIDAFVPTLLSLISKLNGRSDESVDYTFGIEMLKLLNKIREASSIVLSNICGSTVNCQNHLASFNPVKYIFPMLTANNPQVVEAGWHTINWLIISDLCKVDFIKVGGLEIICTSLAKPVLVSRNVIYCARKLAMLPETRRKLIEADTIPALLRISEESGENLFVTSLALAFVALENSEECKRILESCNLLPRLLNNVHELYVTSLHQTLKVLYVQMNHCRMLMSSDVYPAKCFGVWWVLHLLYGQHEKFYYRDYKSMAVRDQILPLLFQFLQSPMGEDFLGNLSMECLYLLSSYRPIKLALVEAGILNLLPRMCEKSWCGINEWGLGTIENLLSNPAHSFERENTESREKTRDTKSGIPSLKEMSESMICEYTAREDFISILDVAEMCHLSRLKVYFLSLLYCDTVSDAEIERAETELDPSIAPLLRATKVGQEKIFLRNFGLKLNEMKTKVSKGPSYDSDSDSDDRPEDHMDWIQRLEWGEKRNKKQVTTEESRKALEYCISTKDGGRLRRYLRMLEIARTLSDEELGSFWKGLAAIDRE